MKYPILFICCLSSLVACSSKKPLEIVSQEFRHHIDEQSLKTFDYQVEVQNDKRLLEAEGLRGSRKVGKGAVGDDVNIRQKTDYRPQLLKRIKTSLREQAIKSLESRLEQNQFCRQGYKIGDEFIGLQSLKISGQCLDKATADDRQLFPNATKKSKANAGLGLTAE